MKHAPRTFPVVLAGFTAFLDLYATQPLLPMLARSFQATTFAVSLTVTAATAGVAIAAPLAGRASDALGRKVVIVGSAVALALVTGLAATSSGLGTLIMWRFLQGIFTPGVFAVAMAYIHENWPQERVGRVTAAYVSGTVTGGFSGRAISGVMAADVSWEAAFIVLGALNLVAAMALWIWLPNDRTKARAAAAHEPRGSALAHLRNRKLVAAYGVGFGTLFSQVAMFTYVTFRLAAPPFGLSTAALGSIFVVYLIGAAITPMAGPWIDRYGHRTGLAIATGIGSCGALLTLLPSLVAIVAGLSLFATGVFIAQAASTSFVGASATEARGVAIGLYATFYYIGGSAGAALPAMVWASGGWPACVALVIVVQAVALTIAMVFWDRRRAYDVPLSALE